MNRPTHYMTACAMAVLASMPTPSPADETASILVSIAIKADCDISAEPMNFGDQGVLTREIEVKTRMSVTCTKDTAYSIGLNAGTGTGSTETDRKMLNTASGSTATVKYSLLRQGPNASFVQWGSALADRHSGTGTGSAQNVEVTGRVPAQPTPVKGTYSSTVTATVYF